MSIERLKWKHKGFEEILKSRGVMSDLIRRGRAIESASGAGYKMTPFTTKARSRVSVITDTPEAMEDNARNQTLLRNFGAGGA